jgi:hypothetical protein
LTKGIPEISGNKQGQQESKIVNICRIRYLSATLLLALVVPLSACTANPPASPQIINTPAIAANEPASKPAPEIFADNITATGEAPIGTDIQDNPVSGEPSGLMLISAADSDNMSNYLGKKVIVEGTVVETGVLIM